MQRENSAAGPRAPYRGADWAKVQQRWSAGAGRPAQPAHAPPRLGSSTHFVTYHDAARGYAGPGYLATLSGYGPNGGELVLRTVHEQPRTHTPERTSAPRFPAGTPRTEADPHNVQKSAWRARAKIRQWVRMMCTPDRDYRLLTGTKRGGFRTLDDCWAAVAEFRRRIVPHAPGTELLAVPELHLGGGDNHGTYHVHMIAVFAPGVRPVYAVFHRIWYRALGGTGAERGASAPGNMDFARTHAGDGSRFTACQAARYIAKYVTKCTFTGNVGQKRFTTTHGAPDPVRRYWWEPIDANHSRTRSRAVQLLRAWFPADGYVVLSRTFHDGGDTYHVFSAEPVPCSSG